MLERMKEIVRLERNEIETKIKELDRRLEHLEHIERMIDNYPLLRGKERKIKPEIPKMRDFTPYQPQTQTQPQPRRYTKNKNWSDIETRQLIEMVEREYSTSKIASTIGTNRKRVLNKIYNLKREGKLFKSAVRERPRSTRKYFRKGERVEAVKKIIDDLPNIFTFNDVVNKIKGLVGNQYYKNSGDLNRMILKIADEKGIRSVIEKGRYVFRKGWFE